MKNVSFDVIEKIKSELDYSGFNGEGTFNGELEEIFSKLRTIMYKDFSMLLENFGSNSGEDSGELNVILLDTDENELNIYLYIKWKRISNSLYNVKHRISIDVNQR